MVPNPVFELDGFSRFDFGQGMLGMETALFITINP